MENAASRVVFVCPHCKGLLQHSPDTYRCDPCGRDYPIVCDIPDFRLSPDPYIDITEDRAKGVRLAGETRGRSFKEAVRHYYDITSDDPSDLARGWIAHTLAAVPIAEFILLEAGFLGEPGRHRARLAVEGPPKGGPHERKGGPHDRKGGPHDRQVAAPVALLDLGCGTAGLLVAARNAYAPLVGIDVAFRWLVLGQARLREAGLSAVLVCANAESLPFPNDSFQAVTGTDVLEHVDNVPLTLSEAARVLAPGGRSLWTMNNRYALVPEPHVHLWGVGFLPRRWQGRYVDWRRRDPHPYRIRLRSAVELERGLRAAGFEPARVDAAPLVAPHLSGAGTQWLVASYNRLRRLPGMGRVLRRVAPRCWAMARR